MTTITTTNGGKGMTAINNNTGVAMTVNNKQEVIMGTYLFEVWNVAGLGYGEKFLLDVPEGADPYNDVLLPMLDAADVECWHIDFVYRKVGEYNGSLRAIQSQIEEENGAQYLSLTPGARYKTVDDWYQTADEWFNDPDAEMPDDDWDGD